MIIVSGINHDSYTLTFELYERTLFGQTEALTLIIFLKVQGSLTSTWPRFDRTNKQTTLRIQLSLRGFHTLILSGDHFSDF